MSAAVTLRPEAKKRAAMSRGSKDSVIDVQHLVKVYGGRGQEEIKAVNDVSFSVGEGEFFGFLGPNGAGKTTVIRIITTLLAKTSGSVHVAGLDVERDGLDIRRMIGYTGQSIGVDGELTGRENLWLIGRLYHMPNSLVDERVEELLEVLQLKDAADRRAYTYSGGMRRRLDLGAGLVHHPRVLFLDEPTTGLAPQTRAQVWDYPRRGVRAEPEPGPRDRADGLRCESGIDFRRGRERVHRGWRRDAPRSPAPTRRGEGPRPSGRARTSHARRGLPAAHGAADARRGSETDVALIRQAEAVTWSRTLDTHNGSSLGHEMRNRAAGSSPRWASSLGGAW